MVPLNRVEGDLEIKVELEDGLVSDAWSAGTLYRGFENIILGREAMDALVVTPRICGICSTSHLLASAKALDHIAGITPPPNGVRLRNIAVLAEEIQNDLRQSFLMYTPDFINPAYQDNPLFNEAQKRYTPFQGETLLEVVQKTKKLVEIIAVIGGQWPHSSYMVPGGISTVPTPHDMLRCTHLVAHVQRWYEERVLGCSIDRWNEVTSAAELEKWLTENEQHAKSDLGFFIRYCRSIGLDKTGAGCGNFISYGSHDLPSDSQVKGLQQGDNNFIPAGFSDSQSVTPLDQNNINEHVAYSWFKNYDGGKHPFDGETRPDISKPDNMDDDTRYTWAKAPRYCDKATETGALAEYIVAESPLFKDLITQQGASSMLRQMARLIRPTLKLPLLSAWLSEAVQDGEHYTPAEEISDGEGFGMVHAARGALGHWVKVEDGLITHYQIITPTAWNGSPRDSSGNRGPWETALIGTKVKDINNPIELGHIIRSFDPCLVCTVHAVSNGEHLSTRRIE